MIILGNTLNFVLDTSLATDRGQEICQTQGKRKALQFGFSQLIKTNFMRYTITVLISIFVSSIIIDEFLKQAVDIDKSSWLGFINCSSMKAITPSLITTFVSAITFYVYINNIRMNWAIRHNNFPETPLEFSAHPSVLRSTSSDIVTLRDAINTNKYITWNHIPGYQAVQSKEGFVKTYCEQPKSKKQGIELLQSLENSESKINSTNLLLGGTVASIMYIKTKMQGDPPKLLLFLLFFILSSLINMFNLTESTCDSTTTTSSYVIGLVVFCIIVLFCLNTTIFNSKEATMTKKTVLSCLSSTIVVAVSILISV